jgi:hypothetical protein
MFDEQEADKLAADLAAIEQQLRGLVPEALRIDRDRLMFEAGRAAGLSAQRALYEPSPGPSLQGRGSIAATGHHGCRGRVAGGRRWFWPAATVAMTAATLLLATMLVWQNRSQTAANLADQSRPATNDAVPRGADSEPRRHLDQFTERDGWPSIPPATSGYLNTRYIALTRGVGELPGGSPAGNLDSAGPVDDLRTAPVTPRGLRFDSILEPNSSIHWRS